MTQPAPFDTELPSPIAGLLQLRAGAAEAVVRDERPSDVQARMARPGALEDRIWAALTANPRPALLVLTGSAGTGKSATLNHLLQREREAGAGAVGEHVADATHSDAPNRSQAERLAEFFRPFADGADQPSEPCRAIAMNTGMALKFFSELPSISGAPPLNELESILRRRLGLPTSPGAAQPAVWMVAGILVVNLDQRATAGGPSSLAEGGPGSLFEGILRQLDPADPDGVLMGASRCSGVPGGEGCKVREWCWPMANATLLSTDQARRALDAAARDVALARGRHLSPRALWDAAATLALGGLDRAAAREGDPCFVIAAVAERRDEATLIHAMASNGALGPVLVHSSDLIPAAPGSLVAELAVRDPSYAATDQAHSIIADSGLDLAADADTLLDSLSDGGEPHPATSRAAAALRSGAGASEAGYREWGRVLARAAWLGGSLSGRSDLDPAFLGALDAQVAGSESDDALDLIEEGLAATFGRINGSEHFYPTTNLAPDGRADVLVRIGLVEDEFLIGRADPVLADNPAGAELVGYAPLTLAISVAGRPIAVDYPLWLLLRAAARGSAPSTADLERFLALRQAIRAVSVEAASEPDRPLLVTERRGAARRFKLVIRRGSGQLRATEVP